MVVPAVRDSVYSVGRHEVLREILRYAIRSPHIENFKKVLSKENRGKPGHTDPGKLSDTLTAA